MDPFTIKLISYTVSAVGALLLWKYVIRPCAAWCVDRIPNGPIKDTLTKDRGGY